MLSVSQVAARSTRLRRPAAELTRLPAHPPTRPRNIGEKRATVTGAYGPELPIGPSAEQSFGQARLLENLRHLNTLLESLDCRWNRPFVGQPPARADHHVGEGNSDGCVGSGVPKWIPALRIRG